MATKIRVSTQILRSRANELEQMNNKFHQEVENLRNDENVLSTSYAGMAQKEFHKQFTMDAEKFDKFFNGIQRYIEQIRQDADDYDRVESINREIAVTRK